MNPKADKPERDFKSSSTSSIFLASTISSPNVKLLIKAVATILQSQLTEDMQLGKQVSPKSDLYFFSEEKYVNDYPQFFDKQKIENIRKTPSLEDMTEYIEVYNNLYHIKALYNCAQFSPECCVLCLIYINRIIALTGLSLQSTNWRPLVLVSLMVSQKVWDDKYLSNADFSYIYPFFDTNQLNTLEMKFLEMIQYNVYVKDSLYTKFYLELKSLVPDEMPLRPMDAFTMNKLTSHSKKTEDSLNKKGKSGEFKNPGQYSLYVIS